MTNQAMLTKVFKNEAFDVNVVGEKIEKGLFRLRKFVEDVEYCDLVGEAWIWSIGRDLKTGEIVASTDARFYNDERYECLFLR